MASGQQWKARETGTHYQHITVPVNKQKERECEKRKASIENLHVGMLELASAGPIATRYLSDRPSVVLNF